MRYVLAAVIFVASVTGADAATDDVDLEQTVRAASRFEAIARVCPELIPTDAPRARTYASVYISAAKRVAGDRLGTMMPSEFKRRMAEVEITGEKRWCEDQRRYLHEVGAGEVFPMARSPSRR